MVIKDIAAALPATGARWGNLTPTEDAPPSWGQPGLRQNLEVEVKRANAEDSLQRVFGSEFQDLLSGKRPTALTCSWARPESCRGRRGFLALP